MSNTIQVMLEAIRQAITVMEIDTPNSDVLDLCYKSLSEGEAELRREPFASAFKNNSGCGLYDYALYLQRDVDLAYRDNCLAIIPLFTREEIK